MKAGKLVIVAAVPIALALLASAVLAGKGHHNRGHECVDPIPDDIQAKLLERFGDEGIDADGDGILTCEEVKAFFATKFAGKKSGRLGKGCRGNQTGTKPGSGSGNEEGSKASAAPSANSKESGAPRTRR